ncbi:MAG: choice-of-anchor D domain-containing protein [Casimicrobium sp.]
MRSLSNCCIRVCLTLGCTLLSINAPVRAAPSGETTPFVASGVRNNDFHIILRSDSTDSDDVQKYLSFGWNGWSGRTVRWRYNDASRPASIVASASTAVERIQAAMNRWSAVCNIQFVYDGPSNSAASLANNARDGVNVISWGALSGNTTGVTYAGASGFTGSTLTIDEADMVINSQFNPNLDATLSHEVGHFLGLKHSNQEGAVMSGPNTAPDPSTSYTSLTVLQTDDIAGCRSLYGAPAGAPASPVASVTTTALAFADTNVGSSSIGQSITLSNTGSATLFVNHTIVSGSDFSLLSTTCNAGSALSPGASCLATARFMPTNSGARSGTLTIAHNATPSSTVVTLSGTGNAAAPVAGKRVMVEYRYAPLDYYFITSRDSDKATLDAASDWARTGGSFLVYATQQAGTRSITRVYFDHVARNATRGSHFYTLLDSDLVALANQNPTQSAAPGFAQNEGVDSYAFIPVVTGVGGFCGSGLLPVYRLFRGAVRFPDDPNHRFTTSVSTYNAFVAQGWDGEGVSFCVPAS